MRHRSSFIALLLSCSLGACATANCKTEAKSASGDDAKRAAEEQAKCERRLADMRGAVQHDDDERQIEERRGAFADRASGQKAR